MIRTGRSQDILYVLDFSSFSHQSIDVLAKCNKFVWSQTELWHYRLEHPSYVKIQTLRNTFHINQNSDISWNYSICNLAKQRRLSFISSNNLSITPFHLIHYDIWGPFHILTTKGYCYFLTIVDDCTRFTWVYLLRSKSDVVHVFPKFVNLIQNQFSVKIKVVHFDNDPELSFYEFFCNQGILIFSLVLTLYKKIILWNKNTNIFSICMAQALHFNLIFL